ncbi:MAG: peptidyl-prolyl cis-trans isomerase [Microbacteriaceae bacterium]|nr:peptidyl-prolyl cis-trans isomerase [Burkholderiaceae bacterium]
MLGGLLFALDTALFTRADDPHTIIMGAALDTEARELFKGARGREPNGQELAALRQVWLDNEVLYREGLALQVDRGDTAIRERVIFKALSVVDANVKLPEVSDTLLRDWFNRNRAKYDEPARFDFQEAALAGDGSGNNASEANVRAFVTELNNGTPGDARAGLRVFTGRPQANIVQSYGPAFASALQTAPLNEWRALPSLSGWHAIRPVALTAPKPAQFEPLRSVVKQDWTDATASEQRSAAVRVLTQKYTVKTAP